MDADKQQERNRRKLHGFLEDKLKWHDYTHLMVADDDMDQATWFIHTIGRCRTGRPELIITGPMDHELAMGLISDIDIYEQKSGSLADGVQPADAARMPVMLKDVTSPFVLQNRLAQASARFGTSIRVVQILWPDAAGLFPVQAGYDQQGSPQEIL